MKFDIITVGSATVDAFVFTDAPEKKGNIEYPAGEKLLIKELDFTTGGGGTNTAVGFSRLGLKTGFLGMLGTDQNAATILKELEKDNVIFLGKQKKESTGYSVILDSKKHNRTILAHKGANNSLRFSEVPKNKLATGWFYFSSMVGESFKTQEKLAAFAKKKGIKIAYNPSSYQTEKGARHLRKILKYTDVLILNKDEARMLVRRGSLLEGLRKLGPKIVCVTDGKKGSTAYDGIRAYTAGVHKNVPLVERTGAGDAFASGFIGGIIKKSDLVFALQEGVANSESVIKHRGAKNKLLSWNEAQKIIKQNPVKITETP